MPSSIEDRRLIQAVPTVFLYQWKTVFLWSPAITEVLLALAYFCIAISLIRYLYGNRGIRFRGFMILLFVFALASGATYLRGIWPTWEQSLWFLAGAKWMAALAAIPTAVLLIYLIPVAFTARSPHDAAAAEEETRRQKGKRAEARLLEYEKALESVEEMIAVVDRNYCYLLANRSFINIRGMKREEVVGKYVYEVLREDYFVQSVKPKLDEAFQGKIVKFETSYKYHHAEPRDLLVSYLPIEGDGGVDRVVCVLHDITARKRSEEELRRLSGQLLRLQDEERKKIARDLHDTTGQDLVALATILSQLHETIPSSCRKGRKLAAQCQAVAERSLREVRTLSYMLHPPMLDEAGLEDAIRHFAEGFGERTGIEVRLDVSPDFGRLSQEVELGLFRVVQESLINIQRHSGSYTARIQLERNSAQVSLRIGDTGRGISASKQRQSGAFPLPLGVGIPSMEERVKQVGGKLQIESGNHGTIVAVTVLLHGQNR